MRTQYCVTVFSAEGASLPCKESGRSPATGDHSLYNDAVSALVLCAVTLNGNHGLLRSREKEDEDSECIGPASTSSLDPFTTPQAAWHIVLKVTGNRVLLNK